VNRTDRIYLAVHLALSLLVAIRHQHVAHWPAYIAWSLCAMAAIVVLARKRNDGEGWQFAHDWLP
jgi:hypothetical protein